MNEKRENYNPLDHTAGLYISFRKLEKNINSMKKNKFKRNIVIIAKAIYSDKVSEVYFFTEREKQVINE